MKNFRLVSILFFTVFFSCEEKETPTFKLTATASPIEGGTITYSPNLGAFEPGQTVTITPTARHGWQFTEWGGDESGTMNPLVVEMNTNKEIFGVFVKTYALSYKIIGKGTVRETIVENPSGRQFIPGTTVELTPIPDEGSLFESWVLEGEWYDDVSNENPKRITIDRPTTITVRFVPKPPGDPRFYLAENGITCKCENVISGSKGMINGVEYEAVNNEFLRIRLAETADMTKLCTSLVTDMSTLFDGLNFDQPIGNWDVSNVFYMNSMFSESSFNQSIDKWNVSKVINMSGMFLGSQFNQPIGSWDVSNVNDMSSMFSITFWGEPIPPKFNQPIGQWDVSNVTNMDYMFAQNDNFNQDLAKWCVAKIPAPPMAFSSSESTFPKPVWGTCPD